MDGQAPRLECEKVGDERANQFAKKIGKDLFLGRRQKASRGSLQEERGGGVKIQNRVVLPGVTFWGVEGKEREKKR